VRAEVVDVNGKIADNARIISHYGIFSADTRSLGLRRSFTIFVSKTLSVERMELFLNLTVDGAAKASYTAPSRLSFFLINSESFISAPKLVSGVFSDSGRSLSVCFSAATNKGEDTLGEYKDAVWRCDQLFTFRGDNYTSCTWLSNECIEMVFCGASLCSSVSDRSSITLIEPGDFISLNNNTIKAACSKDGQCSTLYNDVAEYISVKAPLVPLLPQVYLTASAVDGACRNDPLKVDASNSFGSGGRLWKNIVWTVVSNASKSSAASLEKYLNDFNSIDSPIEIPYSMLNQVAYTVRLRLSNFFQSAVSEYSYSSIEIDASTTLATPTVSFHGSAFRVVKVYNQLALSISVTVPSCIVSSSISYLWKVYRDLRFMPNIISTSLDPQKMTLDPYTLEVGSTYVFYVIATTSEGSFGTATATVYLEKSISNFVLISGPSYLLIPFNQSYTMEDRKSVV
jgi:hypothetical protein